MRTDRERLIDISDAIDKIEEQTGLGEERFRSDEMVQVWVVYHLQIIGEAVARLSQALKANSLHPPVRKHPRHSAHGAHVAPS